MNVLAYSARMALQEQRGFIIETMLKAPSMFRAYIQCCVSGA